jgi:Tfp pilus assembly protein PilZ
VAETEEKAEEKKRRKVPKSRLLKAPIRIRTRDGQEDEFIDYVMEADKDRVYIKTEEPYPVGTSLNLAMDLPGMDRSILFKGEVVRINPHKPATPDGLQPGMGIIFDRVTYDNRKLINDYLDKIQSEERSEEYSTFLTWVTKISRPLSPREKERVKKDLLKVLYGAAKEQDTVFAQKGKKSSVEMKILSRIPLFEEFSDMELEEFARAMVKEDLRPGDGVFEEGDVGDKMYVIIRGSVDIIKDTGKGPGQILVTLQPGDFFGEMSLIDDAPRSATAMASTEALVLSISKKDLMLLLDNAPTIAAKIYKFFVFTLNQRLRETNEKIKSFVSMAQEISQA